MKRPGPGAQAKERGKPHCFFAGGKWHAVTPRGHIGYGDKLEDALAAATTRDWLTKPPPKQTPRLMFGAISSPSPFH